MQPVHVQRKIIHCDCDCFYASVEIRDDPSLAGLAVAVGGDADRRGVITTCNYAAREYGVRSAMPSAQAHRLCPGLLIIPPDFDKYRAASRQIRQIFYYFSDLVEPLSLDEAYLDVSEAQACQGSATLIAREIRRRVRAEVGITVSVGVAPNKFLAKLASDLEKPDGFVVVEPERVQAFLDPLPVERLWGVGRVSSEALHRLGIRTVGQLRLWSCEALAARFGQAGQHLWQLAHGIDDRRVVPDHEAKSISRETTFDRDVRDPDVLRAWLLELTEHVAWRLRRHSLRGRTVHLKVRFPDFRTITRCQTLPEATNVTEELWEAAAAMFSERVPADHPPVRLLGMGVSGFDRSGARQRMLFGEETHERQSRLDEVTDEIRARYGRTAIGRAGARGKPSEER